MDELREMMVDGRAFVAEALSALETDLPYTLRTTAPRAAIKGDLVTWREYANRNTDRPVVDALSYEVTVWSDDPDRLRALSQAVNRAMTGLGLHREYASPDEYQTDGPVCYTKTFRFGRNIDKRTMRLID